MSLSTHLTELASAAAACAEASRVSASTLSDDILISHQRELAVASRLVDVAASALADEIAHRSRRELGYDGLAQKRGMRTAEALVQQVAGSSAPTARRLVRVGRMLAENAAHDADPIASVSEPWLTVAVRAAASGAISSEAVAAIGLGLGAPTEHICAEALSAAAVKLTHDARSLTIENLAARARELRDNLDSAGVVAREEELRGRRYLHLIPQNDGMTRLSGMLDPESAAVLANAVEAMTSPRRGGPRFVDSADAAAAELIENDVRTLEQLQLGALVELVDSAIHAHDKNLLGVRRAEVRVLVSQRDLQRQAGPAFIHGQRASVSIATAERHICGGGVLPILFDDDGQALNVGVSQRFHNAKQRAAIAARDGGCIDPHCNRPASMCEVHHITEFSRGGATSVEDGVLLCRHHHMLIHNNGWRIKRVLSKYWLVPPPDIGSPPGTVAATAAGSVAGATAGSVAGATAGPIPLSTKSPAVRRLLSTS